MSEELKALAHNRLGLALAKKSRFEPVQITASTSQVRILGRQPNEDMGNLVLVIDALLAAEEKQQSWALDVSKTYFRKQFPSGKKVVQGMRFIIEAPDVTPIIELLASIVDTTRTIPRQVRVDEFPLVGAGMSRTSTNPRGRGARPTK
jgi:hypothetical protein